MNQIDSTVWQDAAVSSKYLEGVRGALPLASHQMDVLLRMARAMDRPVGRVLDLGCGDGILAATVLDAFPAAKAVLADFSETMLDAARRRFAATPERVTVAAIDYGREDWRDALPAGRFDVVVSGYSIHHQTDERKRRIYGEIFELLEPGGLFVNVEHVSSATDWGRRLSEENLVDAIYAYQQRRNSGKSREEVAREYVYREDKQANILAPVEDQCRWLREIGFEDVDCYLKIFELAVFGGRRPA
ncbi:MAG: methyltransferase domain-containing protein [Acidobacteria bacterium]|nr:methyltransferase domain-containing protein [Acidobacteriota bacterium]